MAKTIAKSESFLPTFLKLDLVSRSQYWVLSVLSVVSGILLLTALAHVKITLPYTPVPITGQSFGILLVALLMGQRLATLTTSLYLSAGFVGAPVFADVLGAHTLGYLFGMLAATYMVSGLADKGWAHKLVPCLAVALLGKVFIFGFGLLGLGLVLGSFQQVLVLGLYPFIPGAIIKTSLAVAIALSLSPRR